MQPPLPPSNLEAIREAVQELYKPGLRQVGRLNFISYPKAIDKENPYPRGYRVLEFSLFTGENGQLTLDHMAKFIVQCVELANYEIFSYLKLRLFPNSLTRAAFTWYATMPRNYIMS